MRKYSQTIVLCLFMVFASSIHAHEPLSYGDKVGRKALNAIANIGTSFLEIPKNIINTTNESNFVYGLTGGLAKGLVNTIGRTATGVTDLITAPIPTKPIVHPAYIWDDYDADTRYGKIFRLDR